MGGGGATNKQVNTAVGGQTNLAQTGLANQQQQYQQGRADQTRTTGFFGNEMQNGMPYYRNMTDYAGGNTAQAFAPARGQLLRSTSQYQNLPSGYRDALMTNLNAQQGRAFDSQLMQAQIAQQQAKQQGAAGLTGEEQIAASQALGYGSQAGNANQSILNAPRKPTVAGTLGGAAYQGLKTASLFAA